MVRPTKHALDAVGLIGLIGAVSAVGLVHAVCLVHLVGMVKCWVCCSVGVVGVFEPSTNTHGQIQSEYQPFGEANPNMVVLAGWVSISNMMLGPGWVTISTNTCVYRLVIHESVLFGWLLDSSAAI